VNPLTGVLSEAWDIYKAHARHLLSIAFVVYVVAAAVETLLGLAGTFGVLLAFIVSLVAIFVLQAALVKAVEDVRDGRVDLSFSETMQAARPAVGRVALTSIVAGIGIFIGFVLLVIPGLFLLTIWCLVVPVVVLERRGTFEALERSRALVRGHGWQVFGTLVLAFLVVLVTNVVITLILSGLPMAARNFISEIVSGTLTAPFLSLVLTLGYFRLIAAEGGAAEEPPAPPYPTGYGAG
jgi:uncharacterized membrane protein